MQNNILKNYIEQSGLSLRELSEKSGINISRLSRAQNSKRLAWPRLQRARGGRDSPHVVRPASAPSAKDHRKLTAGKVRCTT